MAEENPNGRLITLTNGVLSITMTLLGWMSSRIGSRPRWFCRCRALHAPIESERELLTRWSCRVSEPPKGQPLLLKTL
jgi:hypothetical protein